MGSATLCVLCPEDKRPFVLMIAVMLASVLKPRKHLAKLSGPLILAAFVGMLGGFALLDAIHFAVIPPEFRLYVFGLTYGLFLGLTIMHDLNHV